MALNEMIAQGAQFKMPDPLDQYGRIAQIQQAQNQNALAQYQINSAQRADETNTNFLNDLRAAGNDPAKQRQALINAGKVKEAAELETSALTRQKTQGDIQKQLREDFNSRLLDLSKNPSNANLTAHAEEIAADPNFPDAFKKTASRKFNELKGMSVEDRAKLLAMAGMTGAEMSTAGIAQQKLVAPNPMQITLPNGGIIFVDKNPYSPTFKQEVLPSQAAGMTPFQTGTLDVGKERNLIAKGQLGVAQGRLAVEQNNANAPQYMVTDQGVVALPKRPKPGEITGALVMGPSGEPLQKELKPIPANINTAISTNNQTLKSIDEAIRLIKENPDAVGWKGYAPNKILNETNPKGVDARAAISNIGSLKLHERSGAAVTASEFPRLAPFIPLATDDAATVVKKLTQMRNIAQGEQQNLTETYTREQGYRPNPLLKPKSAPAPASASDPLGIR